MTNFEYFKDLASIKRISIKRAMARFCYNKKIDISIEDFEKLVARTQQNGYKSAVKFIFNYAVGKNYSKKEIEELLYSLTIEYNMEMIYYRMFPKGNQEGLDILSNSLNHKRGSFSKSKLFNIVKANSLQKEIIEDFSKNI